jgi:molybdopterin converting factor small subunit
LTNAENLILDISNEVDLDGVLSILEAKFGELFTEHVRGHLDYCVIYINNSDFRQLQGLKTKIRNGDNIIIGHVLAGG